MPMRFPSKLGGRGALIAVGVAGLLLAGVALAVVYVDVQSEDGLSADGAASTPPAEAGAVWPMTGLPPDEGSELERPALAAKIDNHPQARPQTGLDAADTVFVELVEGTVRMIALFHSERPDAIGPVRSGRLVDADILPGFEPAFAFSGAAEPVFPTLRDSGMPLVTEGHEGYFRERSRPAPHNLYLEIGALVAAADGLPPGDVPWEHSAEPPDGGQAVDAARLRYPEAGNYGWEWDEREEGWARSQDGAPHVTDDEEQLIASNVVVLDVEWIGDERRPFEPLGEGDATFLRDGEAHEGRWRKASSEAPYELLGADGQPFPLAPGQVWIELLPSIGTVSLDGE